ncbi:FHA domain-containing protein [Aquihabitans daechungensis]|uniref:FHA domain-containing protein n=1 Tax=Aquihabitans daechungensis TaxID=1052257 RepID=UPI003BA01039
MRNPTRARDLLNEGVRRTTEATGKARESAQEITPKLIADQCLRTVVRSAREMPNGSRMVRSCVHVEIPEEVIAELGPHLLDATADQTRVRIDEELARRGWRSTGPTSVIISAGTGTGRHDLRVDLAAGGETVMTGPTTEEVTAQGLQRKARRAELVAEDGTVHVLPEFGDAIVGRDPGCTVVVSRYHEHVSRRHLRLVLGGSLPMLSNTSGNGTWVDGVRVERSVQLRDGAVINLGAPDGYGLVYHRLVPAPAGR